MNELIAKGFIKLFRSIRKSWLWKDKPFARGQAWIDLLLQTSWKDGEEYWNGRVVSRKRGCVYTSMLQLAKDWGWSRGKVERFLIQLTEQQMVQVDSTTNGTTIYIENYTLYQEWGATDSTTEQATEQATDNTTHGQRTDNGRTTGGHTKEYIRNIKNSSKNGEEYINARARANTEPGGSIPTEDEVQARLNAMRERIARVSKEYSNGG